MTKLLNFIGKLASISLEWVVILIILFAFLVRTSPVQTFLAQKATSYFSEELQTKVSIDRVSIVFFNKIALDGVHIEDKKGKKIAHIKSLFVTLRGINQLKREIRIKQTKIEGGIFQLYQSKKDGKFNFDFILSYFSSPATTSSKAPYRFKVEKIILKNIHLKYDDYRDEPYFDEIDYDHINIKNLYLYAHNFSFRNGTIKASILHLSMKEKCGLQIRRFSGHAKVNDKSICMKELKFKTNRSDVYLPSFNMYYNDWEDFDDFDDSVSFDATLNKSTVAMQDIQFFSSQVAGMNQICEVQAIVKDKLKQLDIKQLDLKFGKNSQLKGDLILPDFRNLSYLKYNEKISYFRFPIEDIEAFQFPYSTGISPIEFNDYLKKLHFFEGENLYIQGTNQHCNVYAPTVNSKIGTMHIAQGVTIDYLPKTDEYAFKTLPASEVLFDRFEVDQLIESNQFGLASGNIMLEGIFDLYGKFEFNNLHGDLKQFDFNDYTYSGIHLEQTAYQNDIFSTDLKIVDPNIEATYKGNIEFLEKQKYHFITSVHHANLDALHFTSSPNSSLRGDASVDITGNSISNIDGTIKINDALYDNGLKNIQLDYLDFSILHSEIQDKLNLSSSLVDAQMKGNLNLYSIYADVNNQLSEVFPAFFSKKKLENTKRNPSWDYSVTFKNTSDITSMFIPDLSIAKGTVVKGKYSANNLEVSLLSKRIDYQNFSFRDFNSTNAIQDNLLESTTEISSFQYNDTIAFQQLSLYTKGSSNQMFSTFQWNSNQRESIIEFNTDFIAKNNVTFTLLPSYFHLAKNRWDIFNKATLHFTENTISIDKLFLEHQNEVIQLNGLLSENPEDKAKLTISNFNLESISVLFNLPTKLEGKLNSNVILSTPYTNIDIHGDAKIENLFVNQEEVGTISMNGSWENSSKSIQLSGDMAYRNQPSFSFQGKYLTENTFDNLLFNLRFNQTDIAFTNAFLDPQVLSNISGNISGDMLLTGEINNPKLKGELDLKKGKLKVALLGVNYGLEGKILADKDGFYVNNMPITDEEGKHGSVVATIYHEKFYNWNFDVNINAYEDITSFPGMVLPIDRFLVMNTVFKEGDIYYGKGYATGDININGGLDNLEITANLETEAGSIINFPMYGASDLEKEQFIVFNEKNIEKKEVLPKIDFTGVQLDLNFKVKPATKIKLIFDERLGDEITSHGYGDINLKMNNAGEVKMNGLYTIKNTATENSTYNFVLGPIKQNFIIQEEGTISWNGNPYVAKLDLITFYTVFTSLKDILPLQTTNSQSIQEVKCNLKLSETIEKPKLTFEIELAKAGTGLNDDAKASISRINANKDELNKQFFSLLLWKKFQPVLSTSNTVGTNAVADLVSNQINSLLGDLSKDYKFNVFYNTTSNQSIDNLQTQGTSKLALGVSKNFFDGKLLVNGTIGRSSYSNQNINQNRLIGNLNLELKLNESGTLRVNGFNQMNDYYVSTQLNSNTTQGIGLNYQEEFSTLNEFNIYTSLMNFFSSKSKRKSTKKYNRNYKPIPLQIPLHDTIN